MPTRTALALSALALALAACAAPPPAIPHPEARAWTLVALREQSLPSLPLQRTPQLRLRDGRVSGSSGCNRFSGSYTLKGEALRFGPAASTRMACIEGGELERDFLQAMSQVTSWRKEGAGMEWRDAQGQLLASFDDSLRSYRCDDGGTLLLRMQADGARLLWAGREYAMRSAPVASGVRYVVEQGRRPDWSMEWRSKGDEGLLLEAPLDDSRKPEDLKPFARCKAE